MSTGTAYGVASLCMHCGRPILHGQGAWVGDAPYHLACTQPPQHEAPRFAPVQQTPFDEQLRIGPISRLAAAIDRLAAALEARPLKADAKDRKS